MTAVRSGVNFTTDTEAAALYATPAITGRPPLRSGWKYRPPAVTISTGTLSLNNARLAPMPIPAASSLSAMEVEVTTLAAAGSFIRPMLYADAGDGTPGALVMDGGQLDATTTGVRTYTPASPVAVPAGLYWIGAVLQGNAACSFRSITASPINCLSPNGASQSNIPFAWQATMAGAPPAMFVLGSVNDAVGTAALAAVIVA